ncbi:MAG: SusF/SusE family outer membrane protein [Bacteroidota bacterium]
MKANNILYKSALLLTALLVVASCEEEKVKPTLPDSSAFVAPSLKNDATKPKVELLPANAANEFEKFEWDKAQYGLQVSTNYVVEVDKNANFTNPQVLAETSASSAAVTVEKFNAALLALGLPGFQEATVSVRVKSAINGIENDPLFSGVITRTVKTYQNSECGKYCTIGIIGSATAGGWSTDTDMRVADPSDKSIWSTIVYLVAGEAKFREGDDWAINWGASAFPSGTGVQGGANIPIANPGYYKVTFNENTGAYNFTSLTTPVFTTVGIIGSGTAGGWSTDTDLTQDANDPHVWSGTITLTTGEVKFRAENDWANNWGGKTAPSGFGTGGGDNIQVAVGGTYFVRFNDATGEYYLGAVGNAAPYTTVGLVGTAQSGGWGGDTDLIKNPANPYLWSKIITITDGEAKFRANDDWTANWGDSKFPGGIGTQGGNNIPTKAGKYFITFNSSTGEYYFLK